MKNDLTKGSIGKALVLFTIPLILSGLLQQVFNWVDAFIVGNVEGELALAAIGATGSIYHLFVNVIIGFTSGLSVLAAQQCGMGKKRGGPKGPGRLYDPAGRCVFGGGGRRVWVLPPDPDPVGYPAKHLLHGKKLP